MGNNPVNFNDPTGHMETGSCGAHGEECGGGSRGGGDGGNSSGGGDHEDRHHGRHHNDDIIKPPAPRVYGPPATIYPQLSQSCNMTPCPNTSLKEPYDFVFPWELNRLNGIGFRGIDLSGWLPDFPFLGGDFSVDMIYNIQSNELSLFPSGTGLYGVGEGAAGSPSLVLVYDAPNNDALKGSSSGMQIDLTTAVGFKASYSTGKQAQVYTFGPSFGAELSISGTISLSPWNIHLFPR